MSFQYGCDFSVLDIAGDQNDRRSFEKELADEGEISARLIELLTPCQTVIREDNYIDYDHRAAFASQYYLRHLDTDRRCTRLHFFACPVSKEDLLKMSSGMWKHYLGFTVIRPLGLNKFGPTILSPRLFVRDSKEQKVYVTCQASYWANIAGNAIRFVGVPWIQRDVFVSECATASLWIASWHMAHRFAPSFKIHQTSHITELATRSIPTVGRYSVPTTLTVEQTMDALKAMGYHPILHTPRSRDEAQSTTYYYVESGIPVIAVIAHLGFDDEFNHAVSIVGHTFDNSLTKHNEIQHPEVAEMRFSRTSDFADSFVVQDDGKGPFRLLSFTNTKDEDRKTERSQSEVGVLLEQGSKEPLPGLLAALIVPMPPGMTLSAVAAENNAIQLLKDLYRKAGEDRENHIPKQPLILRTFLALSNELKHRWTMSRGMDKSLAIQLRRHLLPKWVWVTEVAEKDGLQEGIVIGQIIQDPAGYAVDVLAMHMPHYLELRHPSPKKEGSSLKDGYVEVEPFGPSKLRRYERPRFLRTESQDKSAT